ncbi:oligosaccharide flippase family protein [Candidatus Saccharibacteria bacterium]|nr:oligosaccharide flippase family protein [Candidatus Saccharibacteria bacterium]
MKHNQRKLGAVLSYVSIFASTLIQLLYTPFLIKCLGQSEYGLFSLVSSIIGYLTVLDLGFGNAIIVHTAKYHAAGENEKAEKLHGMFHLIYVVIGIIAGIIGAIVALNTERIFGATMTSEELNKMRTMLLILSLNLFLTFSFSIYSSIITANERFVYQKILAIINTIAKPLLMIPLLFMGYKSIALCVVITIINVAVLVSNYIYCKKNLKAKTKFQGFDKKLFSTIFGYSFFIFLTHIVDKINWSADQFILGAVSGTIAVSVYSAASQLNTMFINLSTAISSVLLPKMSKMIGKNARPEEFTEEFIKVGRIQYYVIFLMTSGLILFGKCFIRLWLGDDFSEAYQVALILIIPLSFPLIQNLGLSIMQAMNKYKFKAISTAIMSGFNILISIFLAQKYGAIGAAIGTAIALVICNILIINIYYYKVIKINVLKFWKQIISMTIIFAIPFTLALLFEHFIFAPSNWTELFMVIGGYSVLFGLIAYFACMNKYEKRIIGKTISLIKRR